MDIELYGVHGVLVADDAVEGKFYSTGAGRVLKI